MTGALSNTKSNNNKGFNRF
jgi:hypothetical protein